MAMFIKSQLVCLLPAGMFSSFKIRVSVFIHIGPEKPYLRISTAMCNDWWQENITVDRAEFAYYCNLLYALYNITTLLQLVFTSILLWLNLQKILPLEYKKSNRSYSDFLPSVALVWFLPQYEVHYHKLYPLDVLGTITNTRQICCIY